MRGGEKAQCVKALAGGENLNLSSRPQNLRKERAGVAAPKSSLTVENADREQGAGKM